MAVSVGNRLPASTLVRMGDAGPEQITVDVDGVLSTSDFLAGDQFSMADITAFAGLAFADFAKVDIPENLHNLIKWRAQMAQRPSIAA